jgi:hypothetical protein
MRASYVIIVSVLLGSLLGAGISWANFRRSPPLELVAAPSAPRSDGDQGTPKVLVDARVHDFGAVEHESRLVHIFKFTNLGDATLVLTPGRTSCTRCTIAELAKTHVEPGETVDVKVEYHPNQSQPKFRQHATVRTNDPQNPIIELTIVGVVSSRYRVVPQYLVLSKVSAKESKTAEIKIYAFVSDEVGVEKYEFTNPSTAAYFEAATQPIPRDQLSEPNARAGCRVLVTLKPGLPVGPIRQTIRLELKLAGEEARPVAEVPIEGTVDSDISIVGRDWNPDAARLSIGAVPSRQGARRNLYLMLRGPHRHDTTIQAAQIDPAWLKVTLGEPRELKTGANEDAGVTQIPLVVEIPPGTPLVNHLGSDQGRYAKVVLQTTHPEVREITMYVQFVVTQ